MFANIDLRIGSSWLYGERNLQENGLQLVCALTTTGRRMFHKLSAAECQRLNALLTPLS